MMARKTTISLLLLLAATAWGADSPGFLEKLFGPKHDTSGGAKEGNFTILLYVCRGADMSHIEEAKLYEANTQKYAGWDNLFIVHKEDHSLLFWGKYASLKDAQPNLKKAKEYLSPARIKVYAKAIVVPLPGKEDVGPPEWNLDNTDPNYAYTVLVAEFHDVPEQDYVGRRDFAVQYCKQLRDEGRSAFYRHTATESIVTIGLFKKSAITDTPKEDKIIRTINDPLITKLLDQFPKLAVNGCEKILTVVDPTTKRIRKVPAPTYLTEIPRETPPNAAATQQPTRDSFGHPQPGKAPGDAAGPGGSAGGPAGAGGARRY
jgi:hypothetical protein